MLTSQCFRISGSMTSLRLIIEQIWFYIAIKNFQHCSCSLQLSKSNHTVSIELE